ncbi:MAG: hypothetical protein ACHQD8_02160, partial [Chitinophagales bacterium]
MRKAILILSSFFLLCCTYISTAQNIIPNSNFALSDSCPTTLDELRFCNNWHRATLATSDYYKNCDTLWQTMYVPHNWMGFQTSLSNAYAGIYGFEAGDSGYIAGGYREYITVTIPPLVIGAKYKVTMMVALADSSSYAIKGFGFFFYKNAKPDTNTVARLKVTPQIDYTHFGYLKDTGWMALTDSFVADSAYFTFCRMRWLTELHVWWLTHARADLMLRDARGVKMSLVEFLKQRQDQKVIDEWVTIGDTGPTRQKVRIIAFRVSDERAKQRREQAGKQTKTRGKGSRRDVRVGKQRQRPSNDGRHRHRVGEKRLQLSEWTILLTNVPH